MSPTLISLLNSPTFNEPSLAPTYPFKNILISPEPSFKIMYSLLFSPISTTLPVTEINNPSFSFLAASPVESLVGSTRFILSSINSIVSKSISFSPSYSLTRPVTLTFCPSFKSIPATGNILIPPVLSWI